MSREKITEKLYEEIAERESEMCQMILDEACVLFRETKDPVTFHDGLMAYIIKLLKE